MRYFLFEPNLKLKKMIFVTIKKTLQQIPRINFGCKIEFALVQDFNEIKIKPF